MIDVWGVASNSIWIGGLVLLLAVLSRAHWTASREEQKLRAVLRCVPTERAMDLGWFLFCVGLACTSRALWERIVWILLGLTWIMQAYLAGKKQPS